MGVLDKFLDIMKLSDDEYEDDDFFDDEYEEEYEEKPRKSFFRKEKVKEEDFEEEYELPVKSNRPARQTSSKVTPMRQPQSSARRSSGNNMEVCVIKPNSVEDAREITETLLTGRTVILNLEGMDLEVAQRIIDFTSGATFAISGNLQKISNYIFLVTPTNVDISGDLQDLLNTSFDASSMRSRF